MIPTPADVTASDIAATSATISWSSDEENFKVKYREVALTMTPVFFDDFENGLGNWTTYAKRYSGTETNWQRAIGTKFDNHNSTAHSDTYVAMSRSYDESTRAHTVDNWLVSPQMTLGDVLKFWVLDDGTYHEDFKVYVSTATNNVSDFELVADPGNASDSWTEITVDLSAYAGQQGYIAIRHTDYDQNYLFIDDFGVYQTYTYGTENVVTISANSCELNGLYAGTTYEVQVQADGGAEGASNWSSSIRFTTDFDLILANAADNSDVISKAAANGGEFNVTLADRTLWKDGDWNTLCLPFSLGNPQAEEGHHFDGTQLEGATVMTLASTGFKDGTLTMTFADATSIEAGKPYIVKWTTTGDNLVNPVFSNVLISDATANVSTTYADFIGTYDYMGFTAEDKSILFLGAENTLHYPQSGASIGACRAYFQLKNGLTAGDPEAGVRAFNLNFGSEDTGIVSLSKESGNKGNNPEFLNSLDYYTLDGVKLDGKPTRKGIYIVNGRKVVIK